MGKAEEKKFKNRNGIPVIIRSAEAIDAERLIEINISVVAEKLYMMREPEEVNYTLEGEIKKVENYSANPGSLYIVAETGGKVVGYLDFQNGGLKRTSHAGSFSIYILKEQREAGIGKILLETLIGWAEKNPIIEKITLAVFSTNDRAQILYKKSGFIEEGRCPKDMKLKDGSYIDSVLMYKFVK